MLWYYFCTFICYINSCKNSQIFKHIFQIILNDLQGNVMWKSKYTLLWDPINKLIAFDLNADAEDHVCNFKIEVWILSFTLICLLLQSVSWAVWNQWHDPNSVQCKLQDRWLHICLMNIHKTEWSSAFHLWVRWISFPDQKLRPSTGWADLHVSAIQWQNELFLFQKNLVLFNLSIFTAIV